MRLHDLAAWLHGSRPDHHGSRRVVVTLACLHSYAMLVAADRPPFLHVGDPSRCFECRLDQTVRSVA